LWEEIKAENAGKSPIAEREYFRRSRKEELALWDLIPTVAH